MSPALSGKERRFPTYINKSSSGGRGRESLFRKNISSCLLYLSCLSLKNKKL